MQNNGATSDFFFIMSHVVAGWSNRTSYSYSRCPWFVSRLCRKIP